MRKHTEDMNEYRVIQEMNDDKRNESRKDAKGRRMNGKKLAALGCALVLTTASITGCGTGSTSASAAGKSVTTGTTTSSTGTSSSQITTDYSDATIYGQVTQVQDDQVTLTLGSSMENMMGKGGGGQMGQSSDFKDLDGASDSKDTTNSSDTTNPPAATNPSDTTNSSDTNNTGDANMPTPPDNGNIQQGQAPDGGRGGHGFGGFVAGDVDATFTITDESIITVKTSDSTDAEKGSLTDITKDAILEVTFDENGAVSAIVVRKDLSSTEQN